jgi:hypothetical protein
MNHIRNTLKPKLFGHSIEEQQINAVIKNVIKRELEFKQADNTDTNPDAIINEIVKELTQNKK